MDNGFDDHTLQIIKNVYNSYKIINYNGGWAGTLEFFDAFNQY